jgi:chromosome partitioning protein
MPVIVIANPKGGVGKSTLSSNIAGYWAAQGHAVMLGDIDPQQSTALWLALRAPDLPRIQGWEIDGDQLAKPPKGVTHVVLDTPAGLSGKRLDAAMKLADLMLIPLQASVFDIYPTQAFVEKVRAHKRGDKVALAVVGNRVKDHTKATEHLQGFLQTLDLPCLGLLRDTQNYAHLAAHGLSLWDVPATKVDKDLVQWQALTQWLDQGRR